jgi:hypothetical protein
MSVPWPAALSGVNLKSAQGTRLLSELTGSAPFQTNGHFDLLVYDSDAVRNRKAAGLSGKRLTFGDA